MMSDYHEKQGDHKELKEIVAFFSFQVPEEHFHWTDSVVIASLF